MSVYLEIYITDEQRNLQSFWRRVEHEVHIYTPGVPILIHTKDRSKPWYFPSGGVESGAHFDTFYGVYVVWIRTIEPADYEHFGFTRMEKTR